MRAGSLTCKQGRYLTAQTLEQMKACRKKRMCMVVKESCMAILNQVQIE